MFEVRMGGVLRTVSNVNQTRVPKACTLRIPQQLESSVKVRCCCEITKMNLEKIDLTSNYACEIRLAETGQVTTSLPGHAVSIEIFGVPLR